MAIVRHTYRLIRYGGRSVRELMRHHGFIQTAALAFYALLSFIPLLFMLIAVAAIVLGDDSVITGFIQAKMSVWLPWYKKFIQDRVTKFMKLAPGLGWLSFVFITWFSGLFFAALEQTLTSSWGNVLRKKGGWRLLFPWLVGPILVIAMIALILFIHVWSYIPTRYIPVGLFPGVWSWLLLSLLFFALYKVLLPGKCPPRPIFWIACTISFASQLVTMLFVKLITKIPDYYMIYGSLSATVLFMLWLQYNMSLLLWGGHYLRLWFTENSAQYAERPRNRHK